MNLNAPADVLWPVDLSPNRVVGSERRSFESLHNAVRFVMEALEAQYRPFAAITVDGQPGLIEHEEINGIYASEEYKTFRD
jgi:hypothetical protein